MRKFILGGLILVCFGTASVTGVDHFARKAYAQGCKDEVLEIVDVIANATGDHTVAEQLKELLYNMCEMKARDVKLKEIF